MINIIKKQNELETYKISHEKQLNYLNPSTNLSNPGSLETKSIGFKRKRPL